MADSEENEGECERCGLHGVYYLTLYDDDLLKLCRQCWASLLQQSPVDADGDDEQREKDPKA